MPDFDFLLTDIKRQKQIAEEALAKAEEIGRLLKEGSITDTNAQKALQESKESLLSLASSLARNANATTDSANTVLEIVKRSSY